MMKRHTPSPIRAAASLAVGLLLLAASCGDDSGGAATPDTGGASGDVTVADTADGTGVTDGAVTPPDGTADTGAQPTDSGTQDGTTADALGDAGNPPDSVDDATIDDGGASDVLEDTLADAGGDASTDPDATADTQTDPDTTTPPVEEVEICDNPPLPAPPAGKACTVVAGGATLLLQGTVLAPGKVLRNGEVLVKNGTIACTACDCSSVDGYAGATRVACAEGVITPGFINAHDHITFTQYPPVPHGDERYEHRHDWRKGLNGHTKLKVEQNPYNKGETWGELRMLLSGVTSINSSGGEAGFIRNLDKSYLLEGLTGKEGVEYDTFPLGDSGGTLATNGCSAYSIEAASSKASDQAYTPHVGEGINDYAHNEFLCLSGVGSGSQDYLLPNTAFIHSIAVTAVDIALMVAESTKLIWSPRSNIDLYGHTAAVTIYRELGATIALGTDWSASGSMNMLRELQCADMLNSTFYDMAFSDRDLWEMATINCAIVLGVSDVLGSLTPGKVADIAIFRGDPEADYRAILDAKIEDTALVLRGGLVQYGDAALVAALPDGGPGSCEPLDVCGEAKSVCTKRETGLTLGDLQNGVKGSSFTTYPLFFCGTPKDEPSCVPFRKGEYTGEPKAGDVDGDGVADAKDNCPNVFNPVRPMDGGVQPNVDGDSDGDACDKCPFDADSEACTSVDPNDVDGDEIPNTSDNCVNSPNPDQADADKDGKGDECDPCADFANPGAKGCPATIYDVKNGTVLPGDAVSIEDAVVTAALSIGFFLQVPETAPSYAGADYSGIFVYNGGNTVQPSRGDLVKIGATVSNYYGQLELVDGEITIVSSNNPLPAPVLLADPAVAATGGAKAEAYEGVLLRVANVTVTDVNPDPGTEKTPINEFVVSGGLRIDDYLYLVTPFPKQGETLEGITGVLRWSYDNTKLEPRDATDIQTGPPALYSFGPALVFIDEGVTGPTAPELVVGMTAPVDEDTTITLTSTAPDVAAPAEATLVIPKGQQTGVVVVTGIAGQATPVTFKASYDGVELTADVRVVGAAEVPKVVALETPSPAVLVSSDFDVTVTLNIPGRPGGTVVDLVTTDVKLVTLPATVTVAEGALSATFTATTGEKGGQVGTIKASSGGATVSLAVELTLVPQVGLLLTEVYYDHPGDDAGYEWVKIYNGTGGTVDLSEYSIGTGGTDFAYQTMQLSGQVGPGECFVVGGPLTAAENGSPTYGLAASFGGNIQNGGTAADGVGLFHLAASKITGSSVPVDAVLYGQPDSNTSGLPDPTGAKSKVHVADGPTGSSIQRTAVDTWVVNATPNDPPCLAPGE